MESYNKVELVVADPAGSVQLYEGLVESKHASGEKKLTFLSNNVATTSSAKHVKQVRSYLFEISNNCSIQGSIWIKIY
jgi:hypothetical protein